MGLRFTMLALGLSGLIAACDRGVGSTLRLAPTPAAVPGAGVRGAALAAVERVVRRFGLAPVAADPERCARLWRLERYNRGGPQQLSVCVVLPAGGDVEVHLFEFLTAGWTPKGDSLRRALADTLARYGQLRSP